MLDKAQTRVKYPSGAGNILIVSCAFSENCVAGSTAASDGGPGCEECAANTYKPSVGREACSPCPEMSSTYDVTGADTAALCLGKY